MEYTIEKSKELKASIKLINDKLQFKGEVDGNEPIQIDYIPPLGDNLGYTSLELLLLSLSSCFASAVLVLLRKMKKTITAFDIKASGIRKEEHPTGFKTISLTINIQSPDVTDEEMNKVIELSDGICPVLSMLKGNVKIIQAYNII